MRLTDEERRIADDVAMHWAYTLDRLDDAWARALEHIAARRKAFGEAETPGTATAAGVAAPPAEASDEVVAWYVEGVGGLHRAWDSRKDADQIARERCGTVVPLVRQGSPRGVVVTAEQREAVAWARHHIKVTMEPSAAVAHYYVEILASLLAAIDAAKGGET